MCRVLGEACDPPWNISMTEQRIQLNLIVVEDSCEFSATAAGTVGKKRSQFFQRFSEIPNDSQTLWVADDNRSFARPITETQGSGLFVWWRISFVWSTQSWEFAVLFGNCCSVDVNVMALSLFAWIYLFSFERVISCLPTGHSCGRLYHLISHRVRTSIKWPAPYLFRFIPCFHIYLCIYMCVCVFFEKKILFVWARLRFIMIGFSPWRVYLKDWLWTGSSPNCISDSNFASNWDSTGFGQILLDYGGFDWWVNQFLLLNFRCGRDAATNFRTCGALTSKRRRKSHRGPTTRAI